LYSHLKQEDKVKEVHGKLEDIDEELAGEFCKTVMKQ